MMIKKFLTWIDKSRLEGKYLLYYLKRFFLIDFPTICIGMILAYLIAVQIVSKWLIVICLLGIIIYYAVYIREKI